MKKIDLTGKKFSMLMVIKEAGRKREEAAWLCKCDCGNTIIVSSYKLRSGHTTSCGCYQKKRASEANIKHADNKRGIRTAEYRAWRHMKHRCSNKNNKDFEIYGGRGIKVCERWNNSFENFLADMGRKPSDDYSIDRIDTNGDYTPENCRWATIIEQANNTRRNLYFDYNGEKKTISQIAEIECVTYSTIYIRYRRGKKMSNRCEVKMYPREVLEEVFEQPIN
ncbi:MAG: hypothetical protein FWD66_10930 [Paludibacter sp.]|nr:hypothetical protein [Paludibacter sp.]